MQLSALRRIVLSLIGPDQDRAALQALTAEEWAQLTAIAQQHRITPHLHARLQRGEIQADPPAAIQDRWRSAHRNSALQALSQRKALLETAAILADAGIACVALKGSWAAWHLYPAAAERPMRDVDVLLPADRALDAFELLRSHGFTQESASARSLAATVDYDKHLPPLVSPTGVRFELHMRLWERPEAIGWWMPAGEEEEMLARAETFADSPMLRYLRAEDQLTHWVIHAAYSNRLNGGPLALVEIDYLLQHNRIDWTEFWARAEISGWAPGAALVLALVCRWRRPDLAGSVAIPVSVAPDVLDVAPDLLLQDLSERKAIGLIATVVGAWQARGSAGLTRAVFDRIRGKERARHVPDGQEAADTAASWAQRRTRESIASLAKSDVRRIGRETGRLGVWLDRSVNRDCGAGDER